MRRLRLIAQPSAEVARRLGAAGERFLWTPSALALVATLAFGPHVASTKSATAVLPTQCGLNINFDSLPCPCLKPGETGPSSPASQPPRPKLGRPLTIAPRTKTSGCRLRGHLPDPACTPGGYFPGATRSVICRSGYSASVRHVAASTKDKVYAE
jgi:hypothetical protein